MNIRTLCLGILHFNEATGYEINKLVADGRFSHFIEASYGSIYPALTKMMEEELVTCRTQEQPGKPSRKIYAITPEGRLALEKALGKAPKANRFKSEFLFLGLFGDLVDPAHMHAIIEQHEHELSSKIADMQHNLEHCSNPGSRFAIGYGIAANEAALAFLRTHKATLVEAEPPEHTQQNPEPAQQNKVEETSCE